MARSEDAGDYIAERQAREAEARGEEVDGEDRAARIREALAKARQDTAEARQQNGLDQPDLDAQLQDAEAQWQEAQQNEQTFEQERESARNEGKFMATAEELKAVNPTAHEQITTALGTLDVMMQPEQTDVLKKAITKGNPRESMLVLHRLTQTSYNPDGSVAMTPETKLQYLASLPPRELESVLDQSRTYLQLEQSISKRFAARYAGQPRRHTRAPAPFSSPKGGANPPKDLASLAAKGESAKDYIRARQQQIKRSADD